MTLGFERFRPNRSIHRPPEILLFRTNGANRAAGSASRFSERSAIVSGVDDQPADGNGLLTARLRGLSITQPGFDGGCKIVAGVIRNDARAAFPTLRAAASSP